MSSVVIIAAMMAAKRRREQQMRNQHRMNVYYQYHRKNKQAGYNPNGEFGTSCPVTLADYAFDEVKSENSVLFDFFNDLDERYIRYLEQSIKMYEDDYKANEEEIELVKPKYKELCNKLEECGLNVKLKSNGNLYINDEYELETKDYNSLKKELEQIIKTEENKIIEDEESIDEISVRLKEEKHKAKFAIFERSRKKRIAYRTEDVLNRSKDELLNRKDKVKVFDKLLSSLDGNEELYNEGIYKLSELYIRKNTLSSKIYNFKDLLDKKYVDEKIIGSLYDVSLEVGKITLGMIEKISLLLDKGKDIVDKDSKISKRYDELEYSKKSRMQSLVYWFVKEKYLPYEMRHKEEKVELSLDNKTKKL